MRPYVCLIEVGYLDGRWSVVESDSRGFTAERSTHRFYWGAYRAAHRLALKRKGEQGDNLRLELHVFDKDNERVKRVEYGRDPRTTR